MDKNILWIYAKVLTLILVFLLITNVNLGKGEMFGILAMFTVFDTLIDLNIWD